MNRTTLVSSFKCKTISLRRKRFTTVFLVVFGWLCAGGNTFPARTFPPDGTTFSQVTQGVKTSKAVPAFSYWNMQFYQAEATYVKFDFELPRRASLALYARRNALPTHTQYDTFQVLSGVKPRNTRSSTVS